MNQSTTFILLILFVMMALQMFFTYLQVRRYQKALKQVLGTGLLGIGQRKGGIRSGEILILSYDRQTGHIAQCKSMSGYTIFATFKDIPEYVGLSLSEIREIGVELDAVQLRRYRKRHPYDPAVLSKKKGALIQAVEAIELRLRHEADNLAAKQEAARAQLEYAGGIS